MALLQVENLSKTYGKGNATVTAVDQVNFKIDKGEFVAIIGATGSGKSTLMHLIEGSDCPTSGNVKIDGQEIYKLNENERAIFRRRNLGIISQFLNIISTLTVEENIMLPCLLDNYRPDKEKLYLILETICLSNHAKCFPYEISGSQQQRVSIGRALINNPTLIIADEPTGYLDSQSSAEIIDLLKVVNRRYNYTLIMTTQDEKIALRADRIIRIRNGKIIRQ